MEENKEDVVFEDVNMAGSESDSDNDENGEGKVYLPDQALAKGEQLVCDDSAYVMLHQAQTGAPCLSFDLCTNKLEAVQSTYPMSAMIVAGTQAAKTHGNNIIVMKMSNLVRTDKEDSDVDSDYSDDEDKEPEKPKMNCILIDHKGCVNRIRSSNVNDAMLVASWSELGQVNIWNISQQLETLNSAKDQENVQNSNMKPVFTFGGHQLEGYGLDWSSTSPGVLATGDCKKNIHIWNPSEGGSWKVDKRPFIGHKDSVEDLQWSPTEFNVLASCSVDKSIRIWDCRAHPSKACMLTCENAHNSDVNVINWNRNEPLIVSGGDDGVIHVWDLRQFQSKTPVASFKHHTDQVTTVEWHPTDSSIFASGGSDDQIAIWDLAVEKDDLETSVEEAASNSEEIKNLPPQLLFIHQGQTEIKELHWHPKLPGVIMSTSLSGFNVFKTISV